MTGDMCVDGDKGPSCQKGDDTMPEMPSCNPACSSDCGCVLGNCVCLGEVSETGISSGDLWKIIGCAAEAVGKVKKSCKKECSMKGSTLAGCTQCVYEDTKCLQAAIVMGNTTQTQA